MRTVRETFEYPPTPVHARHRLYAPTYVRVTRRRSTPLQFFLQRSFMSHNISTLRGHFLHPYIPLSCVPCVFLITRDVVGSPQFVLCILRTNLCGVLEKRTTDKGFPLVNTEFRGVADNYTLNRRYNGDTKCDVTTK